MTRTVFGSKVLDILTEPNKQLNGFYVYARREGESSYHAIRYTSEMPHSKNIQP